jgi:hypothetical protein
LLSSRICRYLLELLNDLLVGRGVPFGDAATCQLGPEERARIFGGTAIEVCRLANLSQAALLL